MSLLLEHPILTAIAALFTAFILDSAVGALISRRAYRRANKR
jgi:hypothetical protein